MEKRLVLLTKYFPPEMGAPQSRLYETVLGLQKRGWQVKVITALPNYPKGRVFPEYRGKVVCKEQIDGIDITRYPLYSSHSKKSVPRIISMFSFGFTSLFSLRRIRKFQPAYIITESPPLTIGLTGLALARLSGAKHIMNVSDIWPLSALRLGAISQGYLYKKLEDLEHYLYKRSYACMGQSEEIKERLDNHGSKRSLLFRNGVDMQRFDVAREKNVGKLRTAGNLKIVYAGLLGIAQGVAELCEHIDFKKLGAELHIYGEGSERQKIEKYVRDNPDKGIVLHKSINRLDIPSTLMQYDITLIPLVTSIYGAVPSKVYEAMAAELPIIFSGGGEGEKLIKQYNTGWTCTPGDYAAISEVIKSIADMDDSELSLIKENCLDAARSVFDRNIQINNLHRFLEKNI